MRHWPSRYFSGLPKSIQVLRAKELIKRQTTRHPKLSISNTFAKPKKSSWTLLFHKVYPNVKFSEISKKIGISNSNIKTVYDRGLKAWKTSGSRPGATAQQWAIARVYKFVLVSKKKAKNTPIDPDNNLRSK